MYYIFLDALVLAFKLNWLMYLYNETAVSFLQGQLSAKWDSCLIFELLRGQPFVVNLSAVASRLSRKRVQMYEV